MTTTTADRTLQSAAIVLQPLPQVTLRWVRPSCADPAAVQAALQQLAGR